MKNTGRESLGDIRVLDFGHVLAGPVAAMILGDLGAEVIHVEPFSGDDARQFGPFIGGQSAYFISVNRNKKSLVVDLKKEKGKKLVRRLIEISDVLIENFRPDVMEKLGLSYRHARELNQRLVYASISGFGHDVLPEYEGRPSYDILAQAYSGLMSITGTEDGRRVRVGSSVGDIMAGHQCAISILAALHHRGMTGEGQKIDQAMVDGLVYTLENALVRYSVEGKVPAPLGTKHPSITPFQAFDTADGQIVIPAGNDRLWARLCGVLGRAEWADDPRFSTNAARTENRDTLAELLQQRLRQKTTGEWENLLRDAGLPNGPVNTVAEVAKDANLLYREMIVEMDQPEAGKLRIAGSPFKLSESPGRVRSPAPLLGEHTREVLSSLLGCSGKEIDELIAQHVVFAPEK